VFVLSVANAKTSSRERGMTMEAEVEMFMMDAQRSTRPGFTAALFSVPERQWGDPQAWEGSRSNLGAKSAA
jgi:hypothetical protein